MSDIPEDISRKAREAFVSGVDYGDSIPVLDAWRIGRALVAEERERCAKIADAYPGLWEEPDTAASAIRKLASAEIANAIRSPIQNEDKT
jgi:hypothetical protein